MKGELTNSQFQEYLSDFFRNRNSPLKLLKDVWLFECPKCGFKDEVIFHVREDKEQTNDSKK